MNRIDLKWSGGFMRSAGLLAGTTAFGQLLTVLVSPLLTRLYTPDDFGVLAIYVAVLTVVNMVSSLRLEQAIPLPKWNRHAAQLVLLCCALVSITTALSAAVAFGWGDALAQLLRSPSFATYALLLPLGVASAGVYQVLSFWAIRRNRYKQLSRTRLSRGVVQSLAQVALGATVAGSSGLILGYLAGQISGILALLRGPLGADRHVFVRPRSLGMLAELRRYRRFPLLSGPAALMNSFGTQMPAIVLASVYGPQVVGLYALGQRVLGAPMQLVGQAVSDVYLGTAAKIWMEDPDRFKQLFRGLALRLMLLSMLPATIVVAFGPELFAFVFGEEWSVAGSYARILVPMFVGQFVAVPLSQTFNIVGRQDLSMIWNALRLLLVAGGLTAAAYVQAVPMVALAVLSAMMLLSYTILVAMFVRAIDK